MPLFRRLALTAALPLLIGACAVGGPAPPPGSTMPAARAGLHPEYRLFYDALVDYGEWVLIEPHGWLFRPTISYPTWRPYEEGFWVATDAWGWVWNSVEPFGWATDHYGRWLHDEYQGWVWQPGLQWGPAWVDWSMAGDYVGWRPLGAGYDGRFGGGDATSWAPLHRIGSTDLKLYVRQDSDLGAAVTGAKSIDNTVMRGGTIVNLGPSISSVERASGRTLPRARVEDLVTDRAGDPPSVEETRLAAERAARVARTLREKAAAPPQQVLVVRPLDPPAREPEPARPAPKKSAPDSTRR